MSKLHLQFFGDFQLLGEGSASTRLNSPRTQALLAFLVVHHAAPQARQHLAFQLWPDLGEAQARANLRYQLHVLRRALPGGQDLVYADELVVQWHSGGTADSDVEEFDGALQEAEAVKGTSEAARAAYQQAVQVYHGDLLPSCYDDWILAERERYRQLYAEALEHLIDLTAAEGEYRAAIGLGERLLRHDPLHEATYRRLMRFYAALGDRVGAVRVYHTCAALLQRELDVEPSPATRAEYERAIAAPAARAAGAKRAQAPGQFTLKVEGASANNLPLPLTSFVGRERELAEVKQLLGRTRLLTLTGAGGSGKTRLALEAAAGLAIERAFADGVWWVDLEALADPNLVPGAILPVLGLREQGGRKVEQVLVEHLRGKQLLLILDNCEHLLSACGRLVNLLLQACPELHVLTTSREPLAGLGERTYPVPPLSIPDLPMQAAAPDWPAAALEFGSVRLFVERAGQSLPTFTLHPQNVAAVLDICRRLDGIPLAIELAAARVRVLSPAQIAARLDESLALLTHGGRSGLPRHRTLRATLDWSYQLLAESERILLRRLAVFAGGFTLDAAEAILVAESSAAANETLRREEVLDLLSALVDKSLVATEPERTPDDTMRYRLLEVIRQYAREKWNETGEAEQLFHRHAQYFLGLAQQGLAELAGPMQGAALIRLEREHDNFRAALERSRHGQEIELGLRLAGALARFWWIRGYARQGLEQLRQLLERAGTADREARAQAFAGSYLLEWRLDHFDRARAIAEENLALQRELGDRAKTAEALLMLANAQGDDKRKKAEELVRASLAIAREIGDPRVMATGLNNLGEILRQEGEYEEAADCYAQVVALNEELKIPETLALARHNLGQVALACGDYARAAEHLRASLELYRELGHKTGIAMCAAAVAGLAALRGDARDALRLAAGVEHLLGDIDGHLDPADQAPFEANLARVRAELGEDGYAAERERWRAWAAGQDSGVALAETVELGMSALEAARRQE